ncbi:Protein OXIDATIVE STRESS 3 [Linum perenne]
MGEAAGNHNHQLQLLVGGLSFMQKKHKNNTWVAMEEDGFYDESRSGNNEEPSSSSSTSMGSPSNSSCFSENDGDEAEASSSSASASSSSSNSSSSSTLHSKNRNHDSPLYELSDLMAQLPIKRGLSKFYQGKSQSYKSLLGSVNSLEDLVKKVPSRRILKVKSKCKSFCWGLERQKHYYGPKPTISKKGSSGSRGSCFSSLPKPPPPPPPPSVATTFD